MAAALNARRCTGTRRIRHWVKVKRITGRTGAYASGSNIATGSSQIACTSLTNPMFSPTRLVSSTVAALQASKAANSSRSWARMETLLAATARTTASASTTMQTKTLSHGWHSQSGQALKALMPMHRPRSRRMAFTASPWQTSTLNLDGEEHVLPSVLDCRDKDC